MNDNIIFETLKELSKHSKDNQETKTVSNKMLQKEPCYIYRDEQTNQIKEIPISKMDSAGSALINRSKSKSKSPAQIIRDSIFGLND